MRVNAFVLPGVLLGGVAWGQVVLQDSGTTASLRGVDSLGGGVGWASGSGGTVLRTVDGGKHWGTCAVPEARKDLDFRGVQGLSAETAVVMSSGKGELSRIYKTVDGCRSWKLVFVNPDSDGFFDAMAVGRKSGLGWVWGDPVAGKFTIFQTVKAGDSWVRLTTDAAVAAPGIGGFAASNTALAAAPLTFVTSGPGGPFVYREDGDLPKAASPLTDQVPVRHFKVSKLPMAGLTATAGAFSVGRHGSARVVVGGEYTKAEERTGTAAYSVDAGATWMAAETMPGGYRSAVVWDAGRKVWLAVGPNGMDVSRDDGKNWTAVTGENVTGWNAISLPFVVGGKGRIGVMADAR